MTTRHSGWGADLRTGPVSARDDGEGDETIANLHVLLVADRGAVQTLFLNLSLDAQGPVTVTPIPLTVEALGYRQESVAAATVAVVDAAVDHAAALLVCRELRLRRATLPIVALLCCPHSVTPAYVRALAAAGVTGLLDLHGTPGETLRALQGAARQEFVIHLQLPDAYATLWRQIVAAQDVTGRAPASDLPSKADLDLLELLARGLGDREMGSRLCLSPHTVKHRVEQLRRKLGAPNRIALAAWAGRYGLYSPASRRYESQTGG